MICGIAKTDVDVEMDVAEDTDAEMAMIGIAEVADADLIGEAEAVNVAEVVNGAEAFIVAEADHADEADRADEAEDADAARNSIKAISIASFADKKDIINANVQKRRRKRVVTMIRRRRSRLVMSRFRP